MTLDEILKYSGGAILLLLTFIEIVPIKINPWSWIASKLGKALNKDLLQEMKDIQESHKKDQEENEKRLQAVENTQLEFEKYCKRDDAKTARRRILRCADELRMGIEHSQEFFDDILDDVSCYNNYCLENPDFKNMKAVVAIEFIKDTYQNCLKENKFL